MSQFLSMFQQMGSKEFSQGIGALAPYFSTIDPEVSDYRPSYCEMNLRNQVKVQNHLGSIHAIAICNAAELVAGLATDASIPANARWIAQAMNVQYLAKAKTDLKVVCDAAHINFSLPGEVTVPVAAYDFAGTKCFNAEITMNIKHAG
ncbi:DUF4442 domain-containing protein [Aestuariicella hydrocarbonica]|uniref:DUF4442 domain-containing protein n=1 Tax=Pseudomaricurvus hydrocarbonicus TaxID=1470433 RepID=A0A9E5MKM8_9GAMM|nr:hotdog fold domain-containing protein [Aestuariicella hydrocarbonica]NHO65587.1 DUF4442 domain-containing protein [Aestuariicella hydrocarbonica]